MARAQRLEKGRTGPLVLRIFFVLLCFLTPALISVFSGVENKGVWLEVSLTYGFIILLVVPSALNLARRQKADPGEGHPR